MQVHQLNFSQNKLYTTSRQLHSLHGLVIHKHALVQKNNIFQRDHKVLRIGLSRKDPHSPKRKFPLPGGVGWGGGRGGSPIHAKIFKNPNALSDPMVLVIISNMGDHAIVNSELWTITHCE